MQIDWETMGTVTDFIFWGSKITADGDCSHEIKRRLLFGRKVMANLDSMLKSRDNPGIERGSPAMQVDSLSAELPGKPTGVGSHSLL